MSINQTIIKEFSIKNKEPKKILDLRLEALEKFNKLNMPDFIYGLDIKLDPKINLEETKLVDNNIKMSDEIIKNLKSSLNDKSFKEKFLSLVKDDDKLIELHKALFNSGFFIHVPKNEIVDLKKLNIEVINNSFNNILIILEENSKLNLTINARSINDEKAFRSEIIEIFCKENSTLNITNLQNLNQKTNNFIVRRAVLDKNAVVNWIDVSLGSEYTRLETTSFLEGENSRTSNLGIFFADNVQQFDILSKAYHNAKNTKSDIKAKGVLKDKSKSVYRGLVRIEENSIKSSGYQKEDILLFDEAEADAVPKLEILNNDIEKCGHGASIGPVNKEILFYIMSRGLAEEEAKNQIIQGFFEPLIEKVESQELRGDIRQIILSKIK